MSSPVVFESVKNKDYFPPLNGSNSFGTADYDAQINTKIKCSINHIFKLMTIHEPNTLHQICELARTYMIIAIATCFQNPQLLGYFLTGNRRTFLYEEGSAAW